MMERQATDNLTLGGRHLDLDSGSSSVWVWFCLCCFVREDPSPKTSFTPRALACPSCLPTPQHHSEFQ